MKKYDVVVKCVRKQRKWKVIWGLKRLGLVRTELGCYRGSITEIKYGILTEFCRKNHLQYYIDNQYGSRSTNYRTNFFKKYRPAIGNKYFCAYCGKLVSENRLSVDHLYPIGRAKKDLKLQRKLQRMGIEDINDVRNLVAACKRCNLRKGKKMGLWIFAGKIGRCNRLWVIRHIIRCIIMGYLLFYAYTSGYLYPVFRIIQI